RHHDQYFINLLARASDFRSQETTTEQQRTSGTIAAAEKVSLLQRDFAQRLHAENIANFHALDSSLPDRVLAADQLARNRISLFPKTVQRRHVLEFNHQQHVVIIAAGSVADEHLVILNDALSLCLFIRRLPGIG